MRAPLSLTLLMIVLIVTTATGHTPGVSGGFAPQQEEKLTAEEEREALDLASRFAKRWRETSDFGQIVDELFIKDFPERLRQAPLDWIPIEFLDKNVRASGTSEELRRYYAATLSFYGLYYRVCEALWSLKQQRGDDDDKPKLAEVISPEVLDVLLRNPTIARLFELAKEDEGDDSAKEDENSQPADGGGAAQDEGTAEKTADDGSAEESEIGVIKSVAEMNDATATLEKANELMRERLISISSPIQPATTENGQDSDTDSPEPFLTSLHKDAFGYPAGTPIIHLDILPFCIQLIKVDGQLKILSVSIYVD